jgi:hypothetical protein
MFTPIEQKKLLNYISDTLEFWKAYKTDEMLTTNFKSAYPICSYIQSCVKANFNKGDITTTCGYCPVYYYGFVYNCKAIHDFTTKDSLIAERALNNLQSSMVKTLSTVHKSLTDNKVFKEYADFVITRKTRISTMKVIPNPYTPEVHKPRILIPKHRQED